MNGALPVFSVGVAKGVCVRYVKTSALAGGGGLYWQGYMLRNRLSLILSYGDAPEAILARI